MPRIADAGIDVVRCLLRQKESKSERQSERDGERERGRERERERESEREEERERQSATWCAVFSSCTAHSGFQVALSEQQVASLAHEMLARAQG